MRSQRDDDDDGIVADGETVRRPMFLMDSVDAEWALHRPGYRSLSDLSDNVTDAKKVEDARSAARDAYIKRTSEAWRDAGRSENAWRTPTATNVATNVEPEPDLSSPPELMQRHLAGELDNEDAQAKRDAAYAAFKAQQANAWKNPPGVMSPQPALVGGGSVGLISAVVSPDPTARARAIERQGEIWRGGR